MHSLYFTTSFVTDACMARIGLKASSDSVLVLAALSHAVTSTIRNELKGVTHSRHQRFGFFVRLPVSEALCVRLVEGFARRECDEECECVGTPVDVRVCHDGTCDALGECDGDVPTESALVIVGVVDGGVWQIILWGFPFVANALQASGADWTPKDAAEHPALEYMLLK